MYQTRPSKSVSINIRAKLHQRALIDQAKQFYLSRGFVESPLQPMTLIMTLETIRQILSEVSN